MIQQLHNVVRSSSTPNLNALSRKLWSDKLICRSCRRTNLSKYSFDKCEGGVTPDPLWCQLLIRSKSDAGETLNERSLALLQFGIEYCQNRVKVQLGHLTYRIGFSHWKCRLALTLALTFHVECYC